MSEKKTVVALVHPGRNRRNKRIDYILTMWKQEHPNEPVEPHVVSPWAIKRGLDKKPPVTREESLRHEISRELRNQYIIDPAGREVRANHAVPIEVQTPKGPKRFSRWLPLYDSPPDHIRVSAQLRRKSSYSDVRQLTLDLESWNEFNHFGATIPIPSFNFDKDLADEKQPKDYKDEPEDDEDD